MSAKSRREKRERQEKIMYAGIAAGAVALAGGIGGVIAAGKKKSKKSDNLEDIKAGEEVTDSPVEE